MRKFDNWTGHDKVHVQFSWNRLQQSVLVTKTDLSIVLKANTIRERMI